MPASSRVPFAAYLFTLTALSLSGVAASQNAATNSSTSVYAGPDQSYPVVAQLDVDSPIEVRGCLDDWSWCDVSFADYRGWVYAPVITYDYEGGYVPFYTYAPSLGIPVVQFTVGTYWDQYYHDRPWYRDRDVWLHRAPPQHHRPPGPPPSAGPPPRSARVERPHEAVPERALRLGRADAQHPVGERPEAPADHSHPDRAQPGHTPPEHPQPEGRPQPEHFQPGSPQAEHAREAEHPRAEPAHPTGEAPHTTAEPARRSAEPQRPAVHESSRPEPPRSEERAPARPAEEHPNEPPH